jgi:hypothetical protein
MVTRPATPACAFCVFILLYIPNSTWSVELQIVWVPMSGEMNQLLTEVYNKPQVVHGHTIAVHLAHVHRWEPPPGDMRCVRQMGAVDSLTRRFIVQFRSWFRMVSMGIQQLSAVQHVQLNTECRAR